MQIISIDHEDFQLDIELDSIRQWEDFEHDFAAAKKRYTPAHFETDYLFTDSFRRFEIWDPGRNRLEAKKMNAVRYPVFFENIEYKVQLDFRSDVLRPAIHTKVKSVERQFKTRITTQATYFISGSLNFKNEPGYFDLTISYYVKTVPKIILFRFEVFPVKLDFKKDFPILVQQIETIYPRLVVDYLKKTYHHFDVQGEEGGHLIWWTIFGNLYKSILRHLEVIVEKPYRKIAADKKIQRVASVRKVKGTQTEKLKRLEGQPQKHFVTKGMRPIEDNYENRFVKHIIADILSHYKHIYKQAGKDSSIKRMTADYRAQLEYAGEAIAALLHDPVFKKVGKYDGKEPHSQVLQFGKGYAGLIKDWGMLKKGYQLLDGLYEIELKDVAYLYQIWCFFGMAELIQKITGVSPEIKKMPKMRAAAFRLSPDKDMQSKMIFRCPNGVIIELYQELRYTDSFAINNAGTLERHVCPDIILRVGRRDQPRNLYLTYLFDAKYRLQASVMYPDMDEPLADDLQQMGNYRDVIFNRREKDGGFEYTREIVGTYVLFPGKGLAASYEEYYQHIILKTNKGGFPFLPDDKVGTALLENRLRLIIEKDAKEELDRVIDQNGKDFKVTDAFVFITPVMASQQELYEDMVERVAVVYAYKRFDQAVGSGKVRYCAPYIEGKGIPCYYEIINTSYAPYRDIYPPMHPLFRDEGRRYMVLTLGNKEMLDEYVQVKGMAGNRRFTQIKYLYRPEEGFIKTVTEKDVYPARRKWPQDNGKGQQDNK